ncbi:MAG: chemotaxis protein CheA [Dehalococcoidia bacterium]|nr:chemotaxis protein CheA [Dehalococcoidia bacterium]
MSKGQRLSFDLDDEDLKLFNEEAEEQLELLDTALVHLEGDPDPDLVQQIFRAAHTLKGSSATIGHRRMAGLTHAMETVLDAVRQGKLEPAPAVVDPLLRALDALRLLAQEVVLKRHSGVETGDLEAELHAALETEAGPFRHEPTPVSWALSGAAAAEAFAQIERGQPVYLVHVRIAEECQLPGIRCYQVLQELDACGVVAWTEPERSLIEAGAGEFSTRALLASDVGEEQVQSALAAVSDVGLAEVRALTAEQLTGVAGGEATPLFEAAPARAQLTVVGRETPEAAAAPRKTTQSVRIDVERLDGLMNLVGELVIDRTRLQQIREQLAGVLRQTSHAELMENLEETTAHLARITDELQEEIMRSRMLPVRSVLTRLPRLVRDVAAKCGKQVELVMAGEETELDRSVIEEISDPLVHILRNAVDHGIEPPDERRAAGKPETGMVSVTAWNQEASIYLAIRDDGAGIDTEALRRKAVERGLVAAETAEAATEEAILQYIFLPGLSTAKALSDVSGRGVGMDIVRTNVERLNGHVTVRSARGLGSEFVIQLPLTLATTKALMVMAGGTVYAIPLVSVTEALAESDADLHQVGGKHTLRLRDRLLPVADLARALGERRLAPVEGPRFVVAARHGDRQQAFLVDRLLGEQDVVVKSLGDVIGARRGLTGATILGDGTLGLIVDTASLLSEQAQLAATA